MNDIRTRASKVVCEHLGVTPEEVTDEANFFDDLAADSLDAVELLMAFEEAFGIDIADEEWEPVKTFGDAVKLVEGKVSRG